MDINNYVIQCKRIQKLFLAFIENSDDICYQDLMKQLKNLNFSKELKAICRLILKIANNHRIENDHFTKIEKILLYFKEEMAQTFSNSEIFAIFKNNKRILLFLIAQKVISVDESTEKQLLSMENPNGVKYRHFFFPELVSKEKIESELFELDPSILVNFDEKRKIGENDSYLCQLIRNDSIEEFVTHVNQTNLSLSSVIKPSIFETNVFLLKKPKTTLIEYAAFFGSIQIFQYLKIRNVELTPSLWLYAIHGNNPEMIHLLEEDHVEMEDKSVTRYVIELMKCHHNELTNYFFNIYNHNNKGNDLDVTRQIFKYYNFIPFSEKFTQSLDTLYDICVSDISKSFNEQFNVFYILCQYDYFAIVDFLLKNSSFELEPYNIYENYLFLNRI